VPILRFGQRVSGHDCPLAWCICLRQVRPHDNSPRKRLQVSLPEVRGDAVTPFAPLWLDPAQFHPSVELRCSVYHNSNVAASLPNRCTRGHGLTVKDTALDVLPLQEVVDITPIPPETKVVPPSGGLTTKTATVPGCAMSAAVTTADS
jgi:hypothetical protein